MSMIGMYLILIGHLKSIDIFFNIPEDKSIVIKNGTDHFPQRKIYKRGEPIRLIHHCTPWRGLNVLLLAMQMVKNEDVTLDVYSSCDVYGSEFSKDIAKLFKDYLIKQNNYQT